MGKTISLFLPGTVMGLFLVSCHYGQEDYPLHHEKIHLEMVEVGEVGNPPDQPFMGFGPYGAVQYNYRINKYEITNEQYTVFLNAVAKDDKHSLFLLANKFPITQGIQRRGPAGDYAYFVVPVMAKKPVNFVSWHSAARFANWMANGQPHGVQSSKTTENGVYDMNNPAFTISRNTINPNTQAPPRYFLPSEDEWYKAAYYDPSLNNGAGGYWLYATKSTTTPFFAQADATGDISNPGPNVANYNRACQWGGDPIVDVPQGNLTTVGGCQSPSAYGTFDQAGNVWEWNEGIVKNGTARGLRQGSANDPVAGLVPGQPDYLAASWADNGRPPQDYFWNAGFRLAGLPVD